MMDSEDGEVDTVTITILIVMLSHFALIGTIGNGLSTFVFYKIRDKTSAQIFILSLSLIDLFTCTIIIPFTIVVEFVNYKVKYDIVCKLYQFLITSKVPLSAFMMVAIALDRYLCICHSLRRIVNPFRTKVVVACLVAFACALGVATSLGYGVYYRSTSSEEPVGYNETELSKDSILQLAKDQYGVKEYERLLHFLKYNHTNVISGHESKVIYIGVCKPYLYGFHLDENYLTSYHMFYSLLFVVCLVLVGVLYSLIYRFILTRRSKKLKQKLVMCTFTQSEKDTDRTKTKLLSNYVHLNNKENPPKLLEEGNPNTAHSHSKKTHRINEEADKLREETRAANIKTAAMLFIVSVVYILAFTPALLMAHLIVPRYKVVFYLYFSYNVANPFIYAFMNQIFKNHLKKLFRCHK